MTRRQIRETIFKMIFRVEFHEREELSGQLVLLKDELEGRPESDGAWELASEEEEAYINAKSTDIIAHIDELDAAIMSVLSDGRPAVCPRWIYPL